MVPVYEASDVTLQFIVNHESLRAHRTGILSIFGFLVPPHAFCFEYQMMYKSLEIINSDCNVLSSEPRRTDLKLGYCHSVFHNCSGVPVHCTIQHHHPGYSQSYIQLITVLDITVLYIA
jgi:hypothetical protein